MNTRIAIRALVLGLASVVSVTAAQRPSATPKAAVDRANEGNLTLGHVNEADVYGMTPLHRAIEAGDVQAAERLIRAGANVNALNRYHVAPLSIAAVRGDAKAIQILVNAGADVNAIMGQGEPVLMTTVRSGNVEAVNALVTAGADVNGRERLYGQTPMMWAAIDNYADVVKLLAEHGGDVNARAIVLEGEPIWRYKNPNDTRTGVNGEALQNFNSNFTKGGLTPLLYAARQGSTEAARALLDLGANPSVPDPEGFTPLLTAIMTAHYDTAAALIENGADVNQGDKGGQTPLFALADMRTLLWIYNRPTPKAENKTGTLDLAKRLLSHGAQVDARLSGPVRRPLGGGGSPLTGKGATPFLRAAVSSDLPLMRLLLEGGADAKAMTDAGTNALQMAAGVRWSDNNMQTATALGFATEDDSIEAIKLLLDRGLDVNTADNQGNTALHGAASRGADKVLEFLVGRGAKLDVRTKAGGGGGRGNANRGEDAPVPRGRTPLDEALSADPARLSTVALLRKLMGQDPNSPLPRVESPDVQQ